MRRPRDNEAGVGSASEQPVVERQAPAPEGPHGAERDHQRGQRIIWVQRNRANTLPVASFVTGASQIWVVRPP